MTHITLKLYTSQPTAFLYESINKRVFLSQALMITTLGIVVLTTMRYFLSYFGVFTPPSSWIADTVMIAIFLTMGISPELKINVLLAALCFEMIFSTVTNNPAPQFASFPRLGFFILMIAFLSPLTSNAPLEQMRCVAWKGLIGGLLILLYASFGVFLYDELRGFYTFNMFSGVLGHANLLGMVCGVTLLLSLSRLINNKNFVKSDIFDILTLLVSSWLIIITSSRGSILAAVLGAISLFIIAVHRKIWGKIIAIFIMLFSVYSIAEFTNANSGTEYKNEIAIRHNSVTYSRDALWNARFLEFKDAPVIGLGFGVNNNLRPDNTKIAKINYQLSDTEPGSSWLSILSNCGLIGLLLFGTFIFSIGKILINAFKKQIPFAVTYSALFVFLLIHGCFEGWVLYAGSLTFFIFWLLTSRIKQLAD